ncbi:MAG: hypothetical protein WCO22_10825 [Betaproteobacteria bacterium]|jgi:hypothetical protein
MLAPNPFVDDIEEALAAHGLSLRGGWQPDPSLDQLPRLPEGGSPGVVWMVGVAGAAHWASFAASSMFADGLPDPLDRWSQAIGDQLASQWGGLAFFPFTGPPYWPFQQWASRAEPLQNSPLMLRIHPVYGLWHAYRFALALPGSLPARFAGAATLPSSGLGTLCLQCDGQPCLEACPVSAFDGTGYRVNDCLDWLQHDGGQPCMQQGCLARRACPVGAAYRYPVDMAAFHMKAFAAQHRPFPSPMPSMPSGHKA